MYPSINLRMKKVGGPIKNPPALFPINVLCRQRHLILLIHGYNVDEEKARATFEAFREMQKDLANLSSAEKVANGRLVEVYWPGDAEWGIVSLLFYMKSIDQAINTSQVLANSLAQAARVSGEKTIDVVAHSMGCRLALELLRNLRNLKGITIRRVMLMAAAVPTIMLDSGHRRDLRDAIEETVSKWGEGLHSLYSTHDMVLGGAFPLGQTLAGGDEGSFPTALGFNKWDGVTPPFFWQSKNAQAGHSDYWGSQKKKTRPMLYANRMVRTFLGFPQVEERAVLDRLGSIRNPGPDRLPIRDRTPAERIR